MKNKTDSLIKENEEKFYRKAVLMAVIIGTFMAVLDSSIVNIAISKMMTVFGVSVDDAQWIITSYTLAMGSVIPLTGYLSDRFGSKIMYMFALAAFTVGSLLCGIAWSNNIMIAARIIQGIGGGMIMPVGMSILYSTFPKEERGTALGFWGIAAMAAPAIGPTLGGYIIVYLDWRLVFTINIPIGIIGIVFSWLLLKNTNQKIKQPFDYIGFITAAVGLVFILYVLGEGTVDWSKAKNVIMIVIGVFSLIIFVVNELTHPFPLMDLRVFKYIPFSLSMLISTFTTMAMYGVVFIMPLFLQNIRGYTAIETGLIMLPSAIVMGVLMPISGKLGDKFGARPLLIIGSIINAVGTYLLSRLTIDTSMSMITSLLIIRAAGLGLSMMPASTEGMNSVPHHLISKASAINSTVRQVASSVSITLLVGVMNKYQRISFASYSAQIDDFNTTAMSYINTLKSTLMQTGLSESSALAGAKQIILGTISQKAFLTGLNATLILSALMGLICIPIALFFKKTKSNKSDSEKTEEIESSIAELSMEILE